MDTNQSIKIIESMFTESRKSLHKNSFYFLLWGALLIPAGIVEYLFYGQEFLWVEWPIMGTLGGIITAIYASREEKRSVVQTTGDRITIYTWGAFGFTMVLALAYAVSHHLSPRPLVLMLEGSATFISGGIAKFRPFIWGGIVMEIGAILCGFVFDPIYHGLIFAVSLLFGYIIPGILLKKSENAES